MRFKKIFLSSAPVLNLTEMLSTQVLQLLSQKAIEAAKEAATFISSYDIENVTVDIKKNEVGCLTPQGGTSVASQVVTEVDIKSQEIILNILNPTIREYDLGILAEEIVDDNSRFEKDYFWCIDPLDGTLPYTQGYQGYSVSIALVAKDGTPVIGVVCNPVTMDVYHAFLGGGAFKNGDSWTDDKRPGDKYFTLINDRSFTKHPKFKDITMCVNDVAMDSGYSTFKMIKQGGAVMNAIWVLENRPACYFKLPKKEKGGGSIWDFAATACIFTELGVPVSDIYGNKLDLNSKESTFMNNYGVLFYDVPDIQCNNMLAKFLE